MQNLSGGLGQAYYFEVADFLRWGLGRAGSGCGSGAGGDGAGYRTGPGAGAGAAVQKPCAGTGAGGTRAGAALSCCVRSTAV